jgi:hypothetical protein
LLCKLSWNFRGFSCLLGPYKVRLHPYLSCGGLLLTGSCRWNNQLINFLNIYGPCQNRKFFLGTVESRGLLDLQNLVIAGDLNFTISTGEIWGASANQDPLADFFISLFHSHGLVDFPPAVLTPTWRNDRMGMDSISKRLDRFYISDSLATTVGRIRTWVDTPYLSDHTPIILQFGPHPKRISYPFKLNSCWLMEPEFTAIVNVVWSDPCFQHGLGIQQCFISKMKYLKSCIKRWAVQHKNRTLQKLQELEHKLYVLHHSDTLTGHAGDKLQLCKQLEADRNKILLADEALWRQRSRVNWIKCGDLNTKFFHCFRQLLQEQKTHLGYHR